MKIKVRYFAQIAEKVGRSNEEIELSDGSTSSVLLEQLKLKYSGLGDMHFKLAVDHNLVQVETDLYDGVEVALLPPFAGG